MGAKRTHTRARTHTPRGREKILVLRENEVWLRGGEREVQPQVRTDTQTPTLATRHYGTWET